MAKVKAAIIGSGNIGTDLTIKVMGRSKYLELVAMVGIDPGSDGLERAKRLDIATTAEGIEGFRKMPVYPGVKIVFDATSAHAHKNHDRIVQGDGERVIDLMPAAIGPFTVPSVNMGEQLAAGNVNLVTCGGQATIAIVAAIWRVARVHYAEIVASVASRSAGPGTRQYRRIYAHHGTRSGSGRRRSARQSDYHPQSGRASDDHARYDPCIERQE